MNVLFIALLFSLGFLCAVPASGANSEVQSNMDFQGIGRQLLVTGRTFVHHTVKRFMIILPAIFFKLGIAFTLLILVTLVAVNNGFIGFLLLVVGLSSVLARLQETRRPALTPVPYISPLPPYHHWDRSDSSSSSTNLQNLSVGQYSQSSPLMTSYYSRYAPNV